MLILEKKEEFLQQKVNCKKKVKTALIDYGSGNLQSAYKALELAGNYRKKNKIFITSKSKDLLDADKIVLPGVGTFSDCMNGLKSLPGMIDILNEIVLQRKKPFLGICVGMQLLANVGYENGNHTGLGWVSGEIKKISHKNLKLPHIGWNEVVIKKENDLIKEEKIHNYYFVHSYYFECKSNKDEVATTEYGLNFTSIISKDNIYGVQFHPEKSSLNGLRLLKNFIEL